MAALLKKRALAEFSQVIQEEPKPPQKKLRLIHKAKSPEPQLDIQSTSTSYDAFQSLLRFQDCLPISSEHLDTTLRSLLDHYKKEKEGFVRAKIASLLGNLAKTPGFNSSLLVDEIQNMVIEEKSHKALSQLIGTLIVIGRSRPQDTQLHQQLIATAKENLADSSHLVRCKALELIGALGSPDPKKSEERKPQKSLQAILGEHAHDIDPRVRSSSFEAMLMWHQRGLKLNSSLYSEVCAALTDDYEGVRLAAVKLVWVLSQLYPDTMVPSEDSEEDIRLINDGFARICHMVNDLTVRVRAEAVGLLGSLHSVSPRFLEQTLDKKLMSNMRRKKSSHERQKEHYQSGEWSTGQKWADDKPKEEVDPDSATLISSGACGAFVHGLEDEYMEVRNAAIDSLCELAKQSAGFANLSQDFLVDMFNDEIEAVRLNAINSLQKISNHIILREDQLEIMLGVLKDFSSEIREALHNMLACTKLGTKGCLNDSVVALLDNIRRYPQDRMSVWKCMRDLGRHHPSLVLPLASDFLNNHPYFDTPEPEMDDPCYTAVLLMVLNATPDCPTLPTLFLDHTIRHYTYLRDSVPELVPDIRLPGVSSTVKSSSELGDIKTSFLGQILDRLKNLGTMDSASAKQLMEITIRDLDRIQELAPTEAASAACQSMYMECQVCLLKLLTGHQWSSAVIVSTQQKSQSSSLINKVLRLSEHMECLFVGLSTADVAAIRQVRLRAHTLQLLTKLQSNAPDARSSCIQYLRTVSQLQRLLTTHELAADAFTAAVLSSMHRLESCEPSVFLAVLQGVLDKHQPAYLKLSTKVQQASATLVDSLASDNTIKFTAGLTASIPLLANIENVKNNQSIRIQVKYPDQQIELIMPRHSHFRQLSSLRHRLITNVRLSHATWSEACHVEISLVMCYNPDRDIQSDKPEHNRLDHSACSSTLELCKPLKVLVSPKPPKR